MTVDSSYDHHLGHHQDNGPCPMLMVFHGGNCEQILWHGWIVNDLIVFIFTALALFLLAFSYEALKFVSHQLLKNSTAEGSQDAKSSTTVKASCSEAPLTGRKRNRYWREMSTKGHVIQTFLYATQVTISYVLMLVFMNFNYWLCLAVISGFSMGFFGFGWIRRTNFVIQ